MPFSLLAIRNSHRARRRFVISAVVLLACLTVTTRAAAMQEPPAQTAASSPTTETIPSNPGVVSNAPREPQPLSSQQQAQHSMLTDREQLLSYAILLFGTAVLFVQYLLLRTPKRNSYEILQLLAINLIVTGTLFLITAGFSAQQISPGLGLFGTIAGYVLGRRAGDAAKPDSTDDNHRGAP